MQVTQKSKMGYGRRVSIVIIVVVAIILIGGSALVVGSLKRWSVSVNDQSAKQGSALQKQVVDYKERVLDPNKEFALVISKDKVVKGPSHIVVNKGDVVHIQIRPEVGEASLTLDGYNISTETDTTSPQPGAFRFVADKTGTFNFKIVAYEEDEAEEAKTLSTDGGEDEVLANPIVLGTVEVK